MLDSKEQEALAIVEQQLATSVNPVVWSSFGKDSLVVLHMVRQFIKCPVISIRHPKFNEKYRQVERVSILWDLEVYNLMPQISRFKQDDYTDIMELFDLHTGDGKLFELAVGTIKASPDEKQYCGIDIMCRPKSVVSDYPWDKSFFGCKRIDTESIPEGDTANENRDRNRIVYPIYDWSDQNVWEYVTKYNLPVDYGRYDSGEADPDKLPTCINCIDKHKAGKLVWCHKVGTRIKNIMEVDMRGGNGNYDLQKKAVIREYNKAIEDGAYMKAKAISEANPDLTSKDYGYEDVGVKRG